MQNTQDLRSSPQSHGTAVTALLLVSSHRRVGSHEGEAEGQSCEGLRAAPHLRSHSLFCSGSAGLSNLMVLN